MEERINLTQQDERKDDKTFRSLVDMKIILVQFHQKIYVNSTFLYDDIL